MMEQNDHSNDVAIRHLLSEYEALVSAGDQDLLGYNDFINLIDHFETTHIIDKALEIIDLAISKYHFIPDFYIKKAQLLLSIKNIDDAMDALYLASHLKTSEHEVNLLKANCLLLEKKFEEAYLIVLNILDQGAVPDKMKASIMAATIHYKVGDFHAMFNSVKYVLDRDSSNEVALEKFLQWMEGQRGYQKAISYLNKLLARDPYSYLAWYILGQAYWYVGEYENALVAYEYSYIIEPKFEAGYKECADLALQMCDYQMAQKVYQEAIDQIGVDAELLLCLGECHLKLGEWEQAISQIKKSIRLDAFNDESYFSLGLAYFGNENYDRAIHQFQKAINLDDSREEYLISIAKSYHKLGDLDKANYYFSKATDLADDQPETWFEHAKFLFEVDEAAKALEILDEGDEFTYSAELAYLKVVCLLNQGHRESGLDLLKEVLTDEYDSNTILFDLDPELKSDQELIGLINFYKVEENG